MVLELRFTSTVKADMAALLPGAERIGGRHIRYAHEDFLTVFPGMLGWALMYPEAARSISGP